MPDRKPYPPQSLDGYHALRPTITRHRIGMKREIARFFKAQIKPAASFLGRFVGLAKTDDPRDAERKAKDAVDHLDINWRPLADSVEHHLQAVAVYGGHEASVGLGIADREAFGAGMRVAAEEWASDRAAELVGMKRQGDFLIPNPNAKWAITDSTRDQLQAYVTSAIADGDSTDQLAARIANAFAFSDERADMIARTEIARADTQGALIGWRKSNVVIGKSWLAGGPRVCIVCLEHEADGPVNLDYVWGDGVTGPPDHPHCLPGDSRILATSVTATSERWYNGDLVIIRTASGKNLSCTPNHPVLTPSGWVAAGLLNEGGDVISCGFGKWDALARFDDEDVPARIEDVTETFARSKQVSSVPVPTAAEHFHGDGKGSEVAIVRADSFLHHGTNTPCAEHRLKVKFGFRGVEFSRHHRPSAFGLFLKRMAPSASGNVSGPSHGAARVGTGLAITDSLSSLHVSPLHTALIQNARQNAAGNVELISDGELTHSANVIRDGDVFVELDPPLDVNAFFRDRIVSVHRQPFSGKVYNIQTDEGFYLAEGVVTHNCFCVLTAVLEGEPLNG